MNNEEPSFSTKSLNESGVEIKPKKSAKKKTTRKKKAWLFLE